MCTVVMMLHVAKEARRCHGDVEYYCDAGCCHGNASCCHGSTVVMETLRAPSRFVLVFWLIVLFLWLQYSIFPIKYQKRTSCVV